jgi:hypothetical protein
MSPKRPLKKTNFDSELPTQIILLFKFLLLVRIEIRQILSFRRVFMTLKEQFLKLVNLNTENYVCCNSSSHILYFQTIEKMLREIIDTR